uniref:Neurotransmitter-gated ion-channel ligand-binding domain-containing protein n=1 Tax=Parascaris univalens TaxID=6257 RepID=A0A914ZTQ3_PARUN
MQLSIAQSEQNLIRLYRHLLNDYESDVRPSIRHDLPINVTFSFSLTQIIDVDERNQIITTNAWIRQNWVDYKLVWDPAEFDNVTFIHIPYERIWRPDVILYNK